jgi:hypothetical protein
MSLEWTFEAKMDSDKIFISGVDGRHTGREWYNTIMDFTKMETFLKEEKDNYTPEQWQQLYDHFDGLSYLSPMNALTACMIKRHILTSIITCAII